MSYYVVKVYGFECDVAGCHSSVEAVPDAGSGHLLADARRQIARTPDCWSFVGGRDVCDKRDASHAAARSDAS